MPGKSKEQDKNAPSSQLTSRAADLVSPAIALSVYPNLTSARNPSLKLDTSCQVKLIASEEVRLADESLPCISLVTA